MTINAAIKASSTLAFNGLYNFYIGVDFPI